MSAQWDKVKTAYQAGQWTKKGGMVFRTMDVACITDRTTGNGHREKRNGIPHNGQSENGLPGLAMDEIKTGTMVEKEKEQWHWQEQGTAWKVLRVRCASQRTRE